MKINIPIKRGDLTISSEFDLDKGLLMTKNPYGVIVWSGIWKYEFYICSSNLAEYSEENLENLINTLVNVYPNIIFEYFENE